MGKYRDLLEKLYRNERDDNESHPPSKLGFIGETIFDFTTYDGDLDEVFASGMIVVLDSILNGKTFEEVGEFPDMDSLDSSKLIWANKAIDKGCKFKGIVGARPFHI